MKTFLALLFALAVTGFAEAPKIITNDDFKKLLTENVWTWERADLPPATIEFRPDGTMRHTRFVVKYTVKSKTQVELRSPADKKTVLTFNPKYDAWEGVDFDGVRAISGKKQPKG